MPARRYSDDEIQAKWREYAAAVDHLAKRVNDPNDFGVLPGSSLAGDDRRLHPFELSQAVHHLINAAVDQLHGIKTVLVVAQTQHLAVGFTLARAALENIATALWMLGPPQREVRLERTLRWHVRNYFDENKTVGHLVGDAATKNIDTVLATADALGIDRQEVRHGYRASAPVQGVSEYTDMDVNFMWSVASGFAHGRPWAYQGLLERETLRLPEGHHFVRLSPRTDLSIWLPLQSLHLLAELLRLRELRAGYQQSQPPPPR